MGLNLSSLVGDVPTLKQCAAQRYLISLIIITPPPDCCPSPNFPPYRADTDGRRPSPPRNYVLVGCGKKKENPETAVARTARGAGCAPTGVASNREALSELTAPRWSRLSPARS